MISLDSTVSDVKVYLQENADTGVRCPCCDRFVKVYRRKLNSGMARGLILAYGIQKEEGYSDYFHAVNEFAKRKQNASTLEFSKLKYWGLVEMKPSEKDPNKKHSGYWRLTPKGLDFVRRVAGVHKYIKLYNGKYLGQEGGYIDIIDALGSKFNYTELMTNI